MPTTRAFLIFFQMYGLCAQSSQAGYARCAQRLLMKVSRFGQLQMLMRLSFNKAGIVGRSSLIHMSITGIPSSYAHCISQSSPSAFAVFFETNATRPSQPLTRVRQFVFQFVSQACLA